MRESIGGAMLFWIVLFLFSIFITFIAFIIKYARVYKIKNTIINYITRREGVVYKDGIDEQLNKMSYNRNGEYLICRYFPSEFGEFYYIELYSVPEPLYKFSLLLSLFITLVSPDILFLKGKAAPKTGSSVTEYNSI